MLWNFVCSWYSGHVTCIVKKSMVGLAGFGRISLCVGPSQGCGGLRSPAQVFDGKGLDSGKS